jgi:predicted DsbA family dithiol-disulfide isomerase
MDRKFLVIIAVLVLGFIGLVFFQRNNQPAVEAIRSNNVYGNLNSKVTLTEFLDFQCEACYAFYPTIEKVKETYKDRVKFQTKYFPLGGGHQYSRLTASYAEAAARQGKFFEMQAKLFQNQKIWEVGNTQEYMDKYAQEIGLDMNKVDKTWLSDYWCQTAIYAQCWYEMYGVKPARTVLVIGDKTNIAGVFHISKVAVWEQKVVARVKKFKRLIEEQ